MKKRKQNFQMKRKDMNMKKKLQRGKNKWKPK